MNAVLNMTRKAISATVVAATIAWSVSLSAFLAPLAASAVSGGTLVKASLPAVYYVGNDGKRYVFPNEKTFKTWYADFSSVVTITDAELAAMPIGGNATYKPGVRMVKITTSPKVYVVDHMGMLRGIASEAVAVALYGANWNKMVDDVPDAFFTNYTTGSDVNSASDFNPASASAAATSINQDKGLSGASSVSGTLSASLSSSQPAGGTLPAGAMGVNVLKLDVRNGGSSSATVNSLTVHRSGAGATTDFSNLYVYSGNDRLTTGRSINSSNNDASFSGLNLMLAAGETKMLWIAADVVNPVLGGGNQHMFSVTSLMSGSTVASGLPVSGPTFSLSSSAVGTVTVTKTGSVTNPKAGEMGSKIATFKIDVTGEDVTLNRVALFQGGSISRDKLTNFVLKQAGLTIATVAAANSKDLIAFALSNPMKIEKGNSRTFDVFADVAGSARTTDTLSIYLDEVTDVSAIGQTFGYGAMVTNAFSSGTPWNTTVDAGQLTVTYNGPAAKDLATNAKDVELFNFTLSAQANLEVRKTLITLDATGSNLFAGTARLTDIKLVDTATGSVVAGPYDVTTAGLTEAHTFTETYNLVPGQSRTFKVTADVANNAPNGMKVKVTLGTFTTGNNSVRNLDTSTYLGLSASDVVPNAAIAGNQHTIKTATITVSASSTPTAQTFVQGSQGVELAGWNFKASDAQATKVTDVTVRCNMDGDSNLAFALGTDAGSVCSDMLLGAKLWNGTTQVGQTKSPTTGGLIQFSNLNLDVAAGQTVTLKLSGNLSSSIATVPDGIRFSVDTNLGDVTALDADGNSLSPNLGTFTGQNMVISGAGQVTVTKAADDTETEAGLVVGGASNVVLGKFKFGATNEELKLTKVRVEVGSTTAVTSLSLYDGSTLVAGPTGLDSNGADFSGITAFVIPKDGNRTLTVKGNLNSVGNAGAATGSSAMVMLMDNALTFEVRGSSAGSSTVISTTGVGDVLGNAKTLRKSKPTISLVALPSTTLADGTMTVLRFTVAADAAGDVSFGGITVKANVSGVTVACDGAGANSSVRKVGDGSNLAGSCATPGVATAIVFTDEQVVSAGTTKTYDVRLDISLATTGDSLSTLLESTGFTWSDNSVTSAHDSTSPFGGTDWITGGTYVKVLPTDVQTLSK